MEYKGYRISKVEDFILYDIHSIGKGALPKSLQGSFNTIELAKRFIDSHLELKKTIKE